MALKTAVLIAFDEKGLGRQYRLEGECLIGRHPDCQVQILDAQVSKHHAKIQTVKGKETTWRIEDLGSLNGVILNGRRIQAPTDLTPNDVVTVGPRSFLFDPDLELLPEIDGDGAVVLLKDQATAPQGSFLLPGESSGLETLPPELLGDLLVRLTEEGHNPLPGMLATLAKRLAFDSAVVLSGAEEQALAPVCVAGAVRQVSVSKTIAGLALAQRAGVRLPDALGDPILAKGKSVASGKLRSVIAAPLWLKEKIHGVVFLTRDKPNAFKDADLRLLVATGPLLALGTVQTRRMSALHRKLTHQSALQIAPEEICSQSQAMQAVRKTIRKVAPATTPVLITGETGSGKDLVAQWLHVLGPRPAAPFVAVNCGALPETLADSELFGHEKGAFTGADRQKPGKLELADDGTLFLDEIGELSLALQVKLLRVLEDKWFYRLGGVAAVPSRFRLIAATHRDLKAMCREGRFREDLFFRLHVIEIQVPPLRERLEDLEPLAQGFVTRYAREQGKEVRAFNREALRRLKAYSWPGNVRELRTMIEQLVVMAEGPTLSIKQLPVEVLFPGPEVAETTSLSLAARVETLERQLIAGALRAARGRKSAAARLLEISRPTLDKKVAEYAIDFLEE